MSASAGTPTSAPKAMSSRLLTMKFMQRAAASSPTSPSTSTVEEPSPKRQKMAHTTPTKFNVDNLADNRAIRAALEEEEAKKQAALDRAAAEAGDTRWVLSFEDRKHLDKPTSTLRVVQAGFANLDLPSPIQAHSGYDDVAVEDKPAMVGRRSFGKFNRVLEKQQNPNQEDSSSSSEDSDDESEDDFDGKDDDDPTGANELIKAGQKEAAKRAKEERKAKKKAEKAELLELAKKRKKKHVSLNGLTSLSGQDNKACYGCGGNHLQKDCPKKRRHQGEDGPPRKSQRTR
ncbi:zinc knuckle protein [Rutstroemia sp. NJR-2017a WRK4]|nr:zinc knuckle protein [Rutstroemia sp. NJR-2017a WRK4]